MNELVHQIFQSLNAVDGWPEKNVTARQCSEIVELRGEIMWEESVGTY